MAQAAAPPAAAPLRSVGWIGLGNMGELLARRVIDHGFPLQLWNRTASRGEELVAAGAHRARQPVDLAGQDAVVVMVLDPPALEEVLLGEGGLLTGARHPRLLINMSTVDPATSARLRSECEKRGVGFLATPVSGSVDYARQGKLTVFASGERAVFDEAKPILDALGRVVLYAGEGERAVLLKLCLNLMLGITMAALDEVLMLGVKGGIDRATFMEIFNESVVGSPFTSYKTRRLLRRDYSVTFNVRGLHKDFELGLAEGREKEAALPLGALVQQYLRAAIARGQGEMDFSVLLEQAAEDAGIDLSSWGPPPEARA
jgi:3-hydroxyisobutyrate dehydrogenase-like beta-hydroxyacid dehydrogenase